MGLLPFSFSSFCYNKKNDLQKGRTSMNHSIIQKIIIILLLLAAGLGGWYFFYWSKTPAYAAGEIQQAVQKRDLQLFKERVDMEKVYSAAVDDTASYLAGDGKPDHALAASILKMLKKQAVDKLVRQTELKFQDKGDKDPSGKAGKIMSAYLGSAALSMTDMLDVKSEGDKAIASVRIHDKKLDKDFIWQVQLEKDVNGNWTATRILNLKDYLKEREEAGK
jgi:flagellar basal body-associated protein FliL